MILAGIPEQRLQRARQRAVLYKRTVEAERNLLAKRADDAALNPLDLYNVEQVRTCAPKAGHPACHALLLVALLVALA